MVTSSGANLLIEVVFMSEGWEERSVALVEVEDSVVSRSSGLNLLRAVVGGGGESGMMRM